MTKTLDIKATTTDEAIEAAIRAEREAIATYLESRDDGVWANTCAHAIRSGGYDAPKNAAHVSAGEGAERVITGIDVSDGGVARFNYWFMGVAKPGVSLHAVALEALNHFEDAASTGQDYTYELAGEFTASGRPEVFTLAREWVTVHHEWQ